MEPKCVLDFMRGYRAMKLRKFNGGIDTHCSRMRQVVGPALRTANTNDEWSRNG